MSPLLDFSAGKIRRLFFFFEPNFIKCAPIPVSLGVYNSCNIVLTGHLLRRLILSYMTHRRPLVR